MGIALIDAEEKMGVQKIAIVCEGKQINYGLNLFHLMQFNSENKKIYSKKASNLSVEIYSMEVFKRNPLVNRMMQIFVGDARNEGSSFECVFKKFGMLIYQSESRYILKIDMNQLNIKEYEEFIDYANSRRKEYFDLEKDYTERVKKLDDNWITSEFTKPVFTTFRSNTNEKAKQLYDCMSFVLYLDFLE